MAVLADYWPCLSPVGESKETSSSRWSAAKPPLAAITFHVHLADFLIRNAVS